ncbi:hypothetical protein HYE67_001122 [Fusarium culmorum]|uniref:Uncharacterized protein n=1 Tax=Fusarium culmorum TaxID=5516 RepID=A0A7S8CZ13_FUSCU|nr:hypothetical protein HYE67_001122 [Fusarium culmorum]
MSKQTCDVCGTLLSSAPDTNAQKCLGHVRLARCRPDESFATLTVGYPVNGEFTVPEDVTARISLGESGPGLEQHPDDHTDVLRGLGFYYTDGSCNRYLIPGANATFRGSRPYHELGFLLNGPEGERINALMLEKFNDEVDLKLSVSHETIEILGTSCIQDQRFSSLGPNRHQGKPLAMTLPRWERAVNTGPSDISMAMVRLEGIKRIGISTATFGKPPAQRYISGLCFEFWDTIPLVYLGYFYKQHDYLDLEDGDEIQDIKCWCVHGRIVGIRIVKSGSGVKSVEVHGNKISDEVCNAPSLIFTATQLEQLFHTTAAREITLSPPGCRTRELVPAPSMDDILAQVLAGTEVPSGEATQNPTVQEPESSVLPECHWLSAQAYDEPTYGEDEYRKVCKPVQSKSKEPSVGMYVEMTYHHTRERREVMEAGPLFFAPCT